jgi:hypothetical protein
MLRRMIRDGAPPEWTPLMRLVAGEIADDARDPGNDHPLAPGELPWSAMPIEGEMRRGRWRDGLADVTGMSARAVSRTLADLAAAGYEMRQPITGRDGHVVTDRRGRVVFAARGHALRFQVPPLLPRLELEWSPDSATFDGTDPFAPTVDNSESSPNLATTEGESSPLLVRKVAESGDPIPSVSPHENLPSQPVARAAEGGSGGKPDFLPSPAKPARADAARHPNERRDGESAEAYRRRMQDALMAMAREHERHAEGVAS